MQKLLTLLYISIIILGFASCENDDTETLNPETRTVFVEEKAEVFITI